eukprot:gene12798-17158_t
MDQNKDEVVRIYSYDGQIVWFDRESELFEVGNFLGGGAAGTVYECEHAKTHDHFALKILNPIGYKIISPTLLRRCNILIKGKLFNDTDKSKEILTKENVWWLLNTTNKQFIAGYYSEKNSSLREFTLNQCIQIWGTDPPGIGDDEASDSIETFHHNMNGINQVIPLIPPKFADFIRRRNRIFREIRNMRKISNHRNVIRLEGVLELVQESKCTIFLIMELANGGELFDRIKIDCGTREDTAKFFFQQLLVGVKHCHDQGVCHRDLKPENLLLQDTPSGTILKIADFGFSARFAMNDDNVSARQQQEVSAVYSQQLTPSSFMDESPLRVLKSVVGSPFYVAPEVMQSVGYDGTKADVWSLGVILYAMLAGNLPFGQELSTCKRFRHFCKWVREQTGKLCAKFWDDEHVEYPQWLFPAKFTAPAKSLIVSMLHPDPNCRISVSEAMKHALCAVENSSLPVPPIQINNNNVNNNDNKIAIENPSAIQTGSGLFQSLNNPPAVQSPVIINQTTETVMSVESSAATGIAPFTVDVSYAGEESKASESDHNVHTPSAVDDNYQNSNYKEFSFAENNDNVDNADDDVMEIRHTESDVEVEMFKMEDDMDVEEGNNVNNNNQSSFNDHNDNNSTQKSAVQFAPRPYYQGDASSFLPMEYNNTTQQFDVLTNTSQSYDFTPNYDTTMELMRSTPPPSFTGRINNTPPVAVNLSAIHPIGDLLTTGDDDMNSIHAAETSPHSNRSSGNSSVGGVPQRLATGVSPSSISIPRVIPHRSHTDPSGGANRIVQSNSNSDLSRSTTVPPSFNDLVKRSSRFITAVPAVEVLEKVERILEQVRYDRTVTPIGIIGKVELNWERFRLEVWGSGDTVGPALCALQLYQIPADSGYNNPTTSNPGSPDRFSSHFMSHFGSPTGSGMYMGMQQPQQLYLVEFVRGQLEIFAFKRFYQWVRQSLSELVKKDYSIKLFDQAASPM